MRLEAAMAELIDKVVDIQIAHEVENDEMKRLLFRLSLDYAKQAQQEKELHV